MEELRVSTSPQGAPLTLAGSGIRALSVQAILLVSASFLLPACAHLLGLPVRVLLPMHWPVILAGLCYGWRSGALVGLAAPGMSFLLSGMPYPVVLPAMTVELAAYGGFAGLFREKLRLNAFAATALAIVAGRAVFTGVAVSTGAAGGDAAAYLRAALVPGLLAGSAQILLLPLVSRWWTRSGGNREVR